MKGTRLWQAPGSPIIQGRSRTVRPFWEVWATGAIEAEVVVLVAATAWALRTPSATLWTALNTVFFGMLLPSVPGCMLGAALGAALARALGWQRPWMAGLAVGTLAGWVSILVL